MEIRVWIERVAQQRSGKVLVSSNGDLWPLFFYSFSPNQSMAGRLIKRDLINTKNNIKLAAIVNQGKHKISELGNFFLNSCSCFNLFLCRNASIKIVFQQLMVFLRVFGYFISSNVLMAISIDRSETALKLREFSKDIFEKVFCDRLPDRAPNVSASHSLASPRCLDPCAGLLSSTVKLIYIHNFDHISPSSSS